jgi:hypothetical protein
MGTADRTRILPENFRDPNGPAETSPLVRNVYPPWVYKLPSSVDFNRNVFNAALAGVAGTVVEILTLTLPATYVGWMQIMGIYILSPTGSQDITFTLRINGAPVEGWDNIQFPPGVANFVVQNFSDLQVRVPDGGKISLFATNNSANAWTVGGKVAGWYHSLNEEQRIYGSL